MIKNHERLLEKYNISYLYYLTHKENLGSILQHGILSHHEAHRKKLNKFDISNLEVNRRRSRVENIHGRMIHRYAPLFFNPKNPMLLSIGKIENDTLILAVDRNVIYQTNTLFSDGNAASTSTKFYNDPMHLNLLDWECINSDSWHKYSDGKRTKMAEVLVYPSINSNLIRAIYSNNIDTWEFAMEQSKTHDYISVKWNPSFFFNKYFIDPGPVRFD